MMLNVLVIGASGMTGRHVVRQLLDQGHAVRVIVRSEPRLRDALPPPSSETSHTSNSNNKQLLHVTEASSVLDVSDSDLQELVNGADAVISCLGHSLTLQGMFGHPRQLVTLATQRLTQAIQMEQIKQQQEQIGTSDEQPSARSTRLPKFVLMNSTGVAHPAGTDPIRSFSDRVLLTLFRNLLPPHADNEAAAAYLYSKLGTSKAIGLEWVVVRPTSLVDETDQEREKTYALYDHPQGPLFGTQSVPRVNVARAMVDLTTQPELWDKYKFQMPAVYEA